MITTKASLPSSPNTSDGVHDGVAGPRRVRASRPGYRSDTVRLRVRR